MSQKIILKIGNQEYEFPVLKGTEQELSFDISALRTATKGFITLDRGFKNTGSCKSAITFLDGEKGILRYRGYDIEDLAAKASFLEVSYLLIFGELPKKVALEKFANDIKNKYAIHENLKKILDIFPNASHPMGIMAALSNALTAFYEDAVDIDSENEIYEGITTILAKLPILAAWIMRKKQRLSLDYANENLEYTEYLANVMFGNSSEHFKVNPIIVSALNKLLILHADHEQNCSTSTVRMVGSSHAGLFTSIASGISALWGPLHGGANQAVIEMLQSIAKDKGDYEKYIKKAKDKSDPFRLMGFGHRVYKNFDPRARIIKKTAEQVLNDLGIKDPILEIAKGLEKVGLNDAYFKSRNLYPNVDFYSGIIYKALGIPTEMFTVMFALGRLPGWIAQWKEMRENKEPIGRPRQLYIGATQRPFEEIEKR